MYSKLFYCVLLGRARLVGLLVASFECHTRTVLDLIQNATKKEDLTVCPMVCQGASLYDLVIPFKKRQADTTKKVHMGQLWQLF